MGDVTYRHVFQDTTTDTRRASMAFPAPLADITEDSPLGRAPAVQEPAQTTPGLIKAKPSCGTGSTLGQEVYQGVGNRVQSSIGWRLEDHTCCLH